MEKIIDTAKSLVRNRIVSWFLLIIMLGCFGFAGWAFLQIKTLKDAKSKEAKKNKQLAMVNDSLANDNARIAAEWGDLLEKAAKAQDSLLRELESCKGIKVNPDPIKNPQEISYRLQPHLFEVGIYGCGSVERGVKKAEKYLQRDFNVLEVKTFQIKPTWFADRNTVFYYSEKGKKRAEEIRTILEKATEQKFVLAMGAGTGVSKLKYDFSFRIHLVGKDCKAPPPSQQKVIQQQIN